MSRSVCLNSDIGELPGESGRALDRAILDVVSRCSIACGGHAGDDESMRATLKAAKARNVVAGAHPSYPDKANFGRTSMALPADELDATLRQQVRNLTSLARQAGVTIDHLKPHGALYNDAAGSPDLARTIVRTAREHRIRAIVGPPGSALQQQAELGGLDFLSEGFADRRYNPDGTLVSRTAPDAMLCAIDDQIAQVFRMVELGTVEARDGTTISLRIDTICLHGDTGGAVQSALALRDALQAKGIEIRAQLAA